MALPADPPGTPPSDTPEQPRNGADTVLISFIEPSGTTRRVTVLHGQSLMDAALAAGVEGIVGQCGGAINCATCLCDFRSAQIAQLPPQHPDEAELLHYVDEASTNSRLTCQLYGDPALAGLTARVVVSTGSPDS